MRETVPHVFAQPGMVSDHEATGSLSSRQPAPSELRWYSNQMRILWIVLLLYAVGFLVFFPSALTNFDEVSYVRQAVAFAGGHAAVDSLDPYTGKHTPLMVSDYPAGTSTLMTPFVWLAGWRGAFLLGLVAAIGCVLITAKWIMACGGSPLYALIILGFPPALVMARTAMSDVPSACLVAAGLWLFWPTDRQEGPWRRFAAGFLAGASITLREPNPFLFAFFFAGALLRRDRHWFALIAGTLAGVATRPLSATLVYGHPLFTKAQIYGFGWHPVAHNLFMYLTALLVMVPGGLIFALWYRGRRAVELIATVAAFVGLFVAYNYNGASSGGLKQWMLSLRFVIPLLPIIAFAMAHTCPRWYDAAMQSIRQDRRQRWHTAAKAVVTIWLIGVVVAGCGVNWRSDVYSKIHRDVVNTLYRNTDPSLPVIADIPATVKFLNELHGRRMLAELTVIDAGHIQTLLDRYGSAQMVIFNRDDSDYWVSKANRNTALLDSLSMRFSCTRKLAQSFPGLGVVQIWNIRNR